MRFFEMEIRSLGPKGDGVFVGSRGPVFVEGGLPGDRLKAEIAKQPFNRGRRPARETVTRARIVELVSKSPVRQAPPCPHFEKCGGCTLQHAKEDFYKSWKVEMVKSAFHQHRVHPQTWLDTVFLEGANRRRITLTAVSDGRSVTLGYFRRRSQEVTPIEACLVADPRVWEIRNRLLPHLLKMLIPDQPVDIFIQAVGRQTDLLFTGPVGHGETGEPDSYFKERLKSVVEGSTLRRVCWRMDEESPMLLLVNRGPFAAQFGELKVFLPPGAFMQPTEAGENELVKAVLAALPAPRESGKLRLADLFAGCGTFAGSMLAHGSVDAYETAPPAVKALARSGTANRTTHELRAFKRDLFRNPLKRDELSRYDAIVMDPPRAGCEELAHNVSLSKVGTVIAVSCNPATFARDARTLLDGNYRLESLQIIDQFQWSHHVEVVGVFRKG